MIPDVAGLVGRESKVAGAKRSPDAILLAGADGREVVLPAGEPRSWYILFVSSADKL